MYPRSHSSTSPIQSGFGALNCVPVFFLLFQLKKILSENVATSHYFEQVGASR